MKSSVDSSSFKVLHTTNPKHLFSTYLFLEEVYFSTHTVQNVADPDHSTGKFYN
jgi:hypothetical protein